MTRGQQDELNYFFVHVFNQILACEEQALSGVGAKDLSVKELHVLEAVADLTHQERNTMTQIADAPAIRVSSLTTAVNTLVRKGYLERGGEPGDRRVIRVRLTSKGEEANLLHTRFHARMVESAASKLEDGELGLVGKGAWAPMWGRGRRSSSTWSRNKLVLGLPPRPQNFFARAIDIGLLLR